MNVSLPVDEIESTINLHVSKAIELAVSNYDFKSSIDSSITEQFSKLPIPEAISQAVSQIDMSQITQTLAQTLQTRMVEYITMLVEYGLANVIVDLKYPDATKDEKLKQLNSLIIEMREK
jgi:hypothetical protein